MAVTRFFRELDTPLVEGGNSASVEPFDTAHARKVLVEFGLACGRLTDGPAGSAPGTESSRFLDEAVKEMTGPDGHVMPVRLSLFAEMVRRRPWAPATLRELGGIEGIGVTFLEETFCGRLAPPAHRLHERAAQAVLKSLLPEASSDLKGNQQVRARLAGRRGIRQSPR